MNRSRGGFFFFSQVLEIEGVGVGVRFTRRFFVHNPTAKDFEFECEADSVSVEREAEPSLPVQPFRCLTRRGKVPAGRKAELVFEYAPTRLGLCERLWKFSIPREAL